MIIQDIKHTVNNEPCYHRKLELINPYMVSALKLKIFIKEDIKDLVQDTNLILINKKDEFEEGKSFWGWAFSVLHFQTLKYFTIKKRKKECILQESYSESFDEKTPRHSINKKEWIISKQYKLNKVRDHHMSERERQFLDKFILGKSKYNIIKEMGLKNLNQYHVWKRRVITRVKTHSIEY